MQRAGIDSVNTPLRGRRPNRGATMFMTHSQLTPSASEPAASQLDGDVWADVGDDRVLPLARLCGAAALAILALAAASLVLV